jgi:hypothetical protein
MMPEIVAKERARQQKALNKFILLQSIVTGAYSNQKYYS